MKFTIKTFGCRVNEAESVVIRKKLINNGFNETSDHPDLILINSCAVTGKAEREVRQYIYQTRRKFPKTKIVLTGCAATLWKNNSMSSPCVDYIIDNDKKDTIADLLLTLSRNNPPEKLHPIKMYSGDKFLKSGRVMIKIGDGCVRNCSYCIVPQLRGKPMSKTINIIIEEIQSHDEPITEVILTTINTEYFGKKEGKTLWDLVDEILAQTDVPLVSFGSINPWSINESFFQWYEKNHDNPRFLHFFHIPIQSGSNKVLRLMHRGYTSIKIKEKLENIKRLNPHAIIGTDVIVGFPGETEKEFEETYEFLKISPIDKLHVFRYSKRPGTQAEKFPNEPNFQEKKVRSHQLIELGKKKMKLTI